MSNFLVSRPDTYPVNKEPPYAHAIGSWDEETEILTYQYNGRNMIEMHIPGADSINYRQSSDGEMCSHPFLQQLFVIVNSPVAATVTFNLSSDAICMRPQRAGRDQAILGQVGRPLIHDVSGLYDINQDLFLEWQGSEWAWLQDSIEVNAEGELIARLSVELDRHPWLINMRPHYYSRHLGYEHHKPWERRPKVDSVSGWCSWEGYRRDVSEERVREAATFIQDEFKAYGMKYLQLDDGFQPPQIPSAVDKNLADDWLSTNENFPSGHDGIVKIVKEHGLEAGVWIYTYVHNKEYAEVNPGFIKEKNGEPLEGDWIGFVLDCKPETLARYITPSFEGFKKYGYTYLKTDGLRHLIYDGLQEAVRRGLMTNEKAEKGFRRYVEYIRDALGEDVFYLSSWGVMTQMVGIADACRISSDVAPSWGTMRMQITESARWFHTNRILYLNDPDHLCVRATYERSRSNVSLVSLSGGLFMISDAISEYDPIRVDLIKKNLPPLKTYPAETGELKTDFAVMPWTKAHGAAFKAAREKGGDAVDGGSLMEEMLLENSGRYPSRDDDHPFSSLWAFHIDTGAGRWCVMGRFATAPLRQSEVKLNSLGLDDRKEYVAFDFWEKKYLGRIKGSILCEAIPLGLCQIVALREITEHPQFLATTRHTSMGAVSVLSQEWQENTLTVSLSGVVGTTESYWIHIPKGFNATGCTVNNIETAFGCESELVKVDVSFGSDHAELMVQFGWAATEPPHN